MPDPATPRKNKKPSHVKPRAEKNKTATTDKNCLDADKVYELLRNEMTYEANLIAHRTNWFLASQAFFFASLAGAINRSPEVPFQLQNSALFPLIPVASLIVCIVMLLSILAAVASTDKIRTELFHLREKSELARHFPKRSITIALLGLMPSFVLPVVFTVCWIIILTAK